MSLYHIKLVISDEFLNRLAQKGYSLQYGARNMERVIRDEVEDKIAKMVLNKEIKEGDTLTF
jgi:ATP-dependent Clp protease ATP-binding subunit ClpC